MNWNYWKRQIASSEPTVGCWYTFCCGSDLREITSEEQLAEALAVWNGDFDDEDVGVDFTYWRTREDAVADLVESGAPMPDDDRPK